MIQLGLLGARGRMGQWVQKLVDTEFTSSVHLKASVSRGDALDSLLSCDAIIDFSSAQGMIDLAHLALSQSGKLPAIVSGSTGWGPDDQKVLESLAAKTPVLAASNFSIGVYAVQTILRKYGPFLEKLGYNPVLLETHHRHKKDAPSGTALTLRQAIEPRHPERIQVHSIRAGEVIGDHEAIFYGNADQIVIGHFAQDRSIFARGAIEVALWLVNERKKVSELCGMFGIEDFFKSIARED